MSAMNKSLFTLIFSLALLPLFGALPEIAHARHGFKVIRVDDLPDVKGRMWRMEYLLNGAELVWLERDDDNMTFAIAFKTVPDDDTGVAHIMEHSVLCGSRKFPVKEPFVELLKSSMATFLNAMTSPDVTVYPVATRNKKDYLNLADVYLDAVFHPASLLDDRMMRQEGWHYEFDGTNLTRNGIVYSEMKAAFGDPNRIGYRRIHSLLFPRNTYGKCSGGDPAHIPELTFERYRAFHERFYHPSNARIFLDGKVDIDATLALLDTYLARFDRTKPDSDIPIQHPVAITDEITYVNAEERGKTILWDGWAFGSFRDWDKAVAMDIITDALAGSNDDPLKRALLEAGLCEDVSFWCDGNQQLTAFIKIQNTDTDKAMDCRRLVRQTLEKVCHDGLDRKRLTAALDRREFQSREIDDANRGIRFFYTAAESWLYGGDPAQRFRFSDLYARLRKRVESGWFEQVLREAILDNPHHVILTMRPSKTLAAERQAQEKAELEKIRSGLSADELERIVDNARQLKDWQSMPESPWNLSQLPRLSLKDIPAEGHLPQGTTEVENGVTVIRPHVATDGILYLDLCFSLAGLADEELTDIPFLAHTLGKLGTRNFSVRELMSELDGKLGRFSAGTASTASGPLLIVHVSALESRKDDALRLLREVLFTSRFDDTDAIAKLRRQRKDGLERSARAWGGDFATRRARMGLSEKYRIGELFNGVSQLRRMQGDTCNDLKTLAAKVLTRERLTVSLTDNLPMAFAAQVAELIPTAGSAPVQNDERKVRTAVPVSEGYEADGSVGYTTLAARLPDGEKFSGVHRVAARIVSLDHLWHEIRVKGGAYGGGLNVSRDGILTFSSWRDPDPEHSFAAFADAGKALADFVKAAESIENYQVATLAKTEPNLTPRQEAETVRELYFDKIGLEDLRRTRREILEMKPQDLTAFAKTLTAVSSNASRCAFAKRDLLTPCRFERIEPIVKKP